MLNTPQVSFAVADSNSQITNRENSLSTAQNWDQTLQHFDNQQKHTAIQSDNTVHTQIVTTDLDNIVERGDTLDRIPVFVDPHNLNQTNHASHGNQETPTNDALSNSSSNTIHAVSQSPQSQITLSNSSSKQVFVCFSERFII